jgi:hypothetical protein
MNLPAWQNAPPDADAGPISVTEVENPVGSAQMTDKARISFANIARLATGVNLPSALSDRPLHGHRREAGRGGLATGRPMLGESEHNSVLGSRKGTCTLAANVQ